jgi:cell division protein FtsZ
MATGEGQSRAEVTGQQLWTNSTVLGDGSLPAQRIFLAIQSGISAELEMDELRQILEYLMDQTGRQAEGVFGHGLESALGERI